MRAIPGFGAVLIHQAEVGLVHERRRGQRVATAEPAESPMRDHAKLLVHPAEEPVEGLAVARPGIPQELRRIDLVGHGRRKEGGSQKRRPRPMIPRAGAASSKVAISAHGRGALVGQRVRLALCADGSIMYTGAIGTAARLSWAGGRCRSCDIVEQLLYPGGHDERRAYP